MTNNNSEPTKTQIMSALRNADAAGDTEAAKRLAIMARDYEETPSATLDQDYPANNSVSLIEEIQSAFMKAHEAGDTENAQILATHLKTMIGNTDSVAQSTQQESTQGVSINDDGGLDISISKNANNPEFAPTDHNIETPISEYQNRVNPSNNGQPLDVPTAENLARQPEAQPKQQGFISKVKDMFTGGDKRVPETEELEAWGGMPELGSMSLKSLQAALATTTTSDKESIDIIQNLFPDTQARQDEKGNYIIRSAMDGKEYAFHPGFKLSDIPNAVLGMLEFTPAGKAKTVAGAALTSGVTQTAKEGLQASSGGEFNAGEVGLASGLGGGGKLIEKGITGAKSALISTPSKEQTLIKEASNSGIDLMTSDVFEPDTFAGKLARATGERVPVAGTGGMRATQQDQRQEAIRNIFREYGADDVANLTADDVTSDLIKKHGASLEKYTTMKGEVIERLSTGKVSTPKTISKINEEIAKLSTLKTEASKKIIDKLEEYKAAFTDQDLINLEANRKQLGDELKDQGLASIRSQGEKVFSRVYGSLRDDMSTFIKTTGERRDFNKWQVANKRLETMIGEGKTTALKSVITKGEQTPEVVRGMLFSQKHSDIKRLYKNLTPKGRASAKTAIMQEVFSKSVNIDNLSPERFLRSLNKVSKSTGVFFNKQEREAMNGLVKALNATRQASNAAHKPTTGGEVTAYAAPTAITWLTGGSPLTGLAATAGLGVTARVYESKPVRNALIRLSKAEKGKEKPLIDYISRLIQSQKEKLSNDE